MPSTQQEQQEIERKYEAPHTGSVPADFPKAGLSAGQPETFSLNATYFDTPAFTLKSCGVAVRRRTGGPDAGWHIKQRRADGVYETAWPDGEEIPTELLTTLRAITRQEIQGLGKIATVLNTRLRRPLHNTTGHVVAEIVDDNVEAHHHVTGERRSWREWEVELVDNSDEYLLDRVEPTLFAAGAYPSLSASKVGRATGALRPGGARPEQSASTVAACAVTDTADLLAGANPEDPRMAQLRELARTLATS